MRELKVKKTIINNIINKCDYEYDITDELKNDIEFMKQIVGLECDGYYIGRWGANRGFLNYNAIISNNNELLNYKLDLLLSKETNCFEPKVDTWCDKTVGAVVARYFHGEDLNNRELLGKLLGKYPDALFCSSYTIDEKDFVLKHLDNCLENDGVKNFHDKVFEYSYNRETYNYCLSKDPEIMIPIIQSDMSILKYCSDEIMKYLVENCKIIYK